MLTTLANVQLMPGMASKNANWLSQLIDGADAAIKSYVKLNLEPQAYVEFYSGNEQRDIVIRQLPLVYAQTTVAVGSNGVTLPTATINVTSTVGFASSVGADATTLPALAIMTGVNTWTVVNYTGVTATSFTGCTNGTGTLSSTAKQNVVTSPVVSFDQGGCFGGVQGSFADGTTCAVGMQYMPVLDGGGRQSLRGLIRRMGGGGTGGGWVGSYPSNWGMGKLSASRLPAWPRGDGNIKVQYMAGYSPIPADLVMACNELVAWLVRNIPSGGPLANESLGSYSYGVLTMAAAGQVPMLGETARTLARYREVSF